VEYKEINGLKLPVLGLGTYTFGGKDAPDRTNDLRYISLIREAVSLGMTHIDTAEGYAQGHSEELVGEAISNVPRGRVFLTTKVSPEHLHHDDLIACAKASLRRLGTSRIDLYLVHSYNHETPLAETMSAMDELVNGGLVKFLGVSNFNAEQLAEAQTHTKYGLVANQVEYNLLTRDKGKWNNGTESEVLPYCKKNGIMFIASRPFAKGMLARPGNEVLDEIAKRYGCTPSQVALNWLISKPNVVTIPRTSTSEHLNEFLGALGWALKPEDMERLDKMQ
jgi:diketogulonate reductase-like aldo/keto reductase